MLKVLKSVEGEEQKATSCGRRYDLDNVVILCGGWIALDERGKVLVDIGKEVGEALECHEGICN